MYAIYFFVANILNSTRQKIKGLRQKNAISCFRVSEFQSFRVSGFQGFYLTLNS
jgi:hypothetical protein